MKKAFILALAIASTISVEAQDINGTWKGILSAGGTKLNISFNFIPDGQGGTKCTMDSPDQGAKGIPAKLDYISKDSVYVSMPALTVKYTGKLTDNTIKGTFTQSGISFPLNLTPGKVTYNRPQNPTLPLPYNTEEITFENKAASAKLSGTISYPVGYKEGKKVPVAIMVSGSGLQNRDEEVFDHKPFYVIADYLAKHGIATLRYDDRGFGKSTGDASNATTKDFADDAKAGIEMLRKMGKFNKIGLLGHSEGGMIAFMLAAKGNTDFIISMAGVGVKGDESLTAQNNKIMQVMGMNQTVTVEQVRQKALSTGSKWMEYCLNYDPTADIKAIKCPVMAINGENDVQVTCDLNLGAIKTLIGNRPKNMVKQYPNLNHLFQHCNTGMLDEYAVNEETISAEVLEDMAKWVNGL